MRHSALFAAIVQYCFAILQLWILIFVLIRTQKPLHGWHNSINTKSPLFILQIAMMLFSVFTSTISAFNSHLTFDYSSNPRLLCSAGRRGAILCYILSSFCVYLFFLYRSKSVKSRFTSSYLKLENFLSFLLVLVVVLLAYVMYSLKTVYIFLEDGSPYCTYFLDDFVYLCFGALDALLNFGFLLLFYLPLRAMAADTSKGMELDIKEIIRKNFIVCAVIVALSFIAVGCSSLNGEIGIFLAPVPSIHLIVTSISLQWCTSAAWVKVSPEHQDNVHLGATEQKPEAVAIEHNKWDC
jgi:hypothetical protein